MWRRLYKPAVFITQFFFAKWVALLTLFSICNFEFLESENTTAVSLVNKAHWDIFPNPATDILTIRTKQSLSEDAYSVRLFSILGTTVYEATQQILPNTDLDLNLRDLPSGTYMLSISSKHGMLTEKIVINHYGCFLNCKIFLHGPTAGIPMKNWGAGGRYVLGLHIRFGPLRYYKLCVDFPFTALVRLN